MLDQPDGDEITEASEAPRGLSPSEVQSEVHKLLVAAQQYSDDVLSDFRTSATEYYLGKPLGNETEGRSQFVMTEVRDTVQAMMPSVMRVFFGGERVVEFRARTPDDVPVCEQASEYVNYLITEENEGFRVCYAAFKDAMIRKLGIVKYWWDEKTERQSYNLYNLSPEDMAVLASDSEIVSVEPLAMNPDGTMNVAATREKRDGCVKIEAVPPEEFVFSPTARTLHDAVLVAHVTAMRPSDLLAMGYDRELVERAPPMGEDSEEEQARRPDDITAEDGDDGKVQYAECYLYLDEDGDGIAEHRRVVLIGDEVADDQPFVGRPFALFQVDPEPHTLVGSCIADATMDLQRVKTALVRSALDSLAYTVNPRTAVVEGQVNMQDALNTEIGAVVRERAPGMIRTLDQPFVGGEAFAALGVFDEVKENRTGQSKAAMGLNPDALQSSTKAAVAATVTASQQHLELLARLLAEGMKDLFKGVLRLVVQYQDRPKLVRLRNTYVAIDPRPWNADMDATVNVALGVGLTEEKLAALAGIAAKQESLLQLLGPSNPLVTLGQYGETLSAMASLAGFKDTTKFFLPLPRDFQPPPAPPKPTPEETYAVVEQMKVQAQIANDSARLDLDRRKVLLEEERQRDKMAIDAFLAAMEMELKYGVQVDKNRVQELVAEQRVRAKDVGLTEG